MLYLFHRLLPPIRERVIYEVWPERKPCPKCGSVQSVRCENGVLIQVACLGCGSATGYFYKRYPAEKAWDRGEVK